jgi:two-component system, probable response regulator PhcQ
MKQSVLFIDDDSSILRGLARVLRHQPYQIYTATSAEEAMLVVKRHGIDVVVVDEHMPGMRGGDLLAWMAEHCPEVVRIALTGHPTVDTAIRAINEGRVYQFFTKPCNPVHLGVAIRKAMEHKDVLEQNRRLTDGNRRQAEELARCRSNVMVLSRVVSSTSITGAKATVNARDLPGAAETPSATSLRAKELVDKVLQELTTMEQIVNSVMDRSTHEQL